jgi:hypothetical protein
VATFEQLVSEALNAPFSGWDFSWLAARSTAGTLPWSYRREIASRAAATDTMLDMGTGGGERLARLSPRPPRTVATEAWPPNVAVAAARLRPLGIPVVHDEGAPDNTGQSGDDRGRLPFGDGVFGLVASRHEAFRAAEVRRVLAPGARSSPSKLTSTAMTTCAGWPVCMFRSSRTAGFRSRGSRWKAQG